MNVYQVKQISRDHFVVLLNGRQLGDDKGFATREAAHAESIKRAENEGVDEDGRRLAVIKPVLF